jgi:acyl-CoA synthetase (AMP-forming)/AMP-acid ligase II
MRSPAQHAPSTATLAHDLARRARQHGDRPAVRFDPGSGCWQQVTYRQLYRRASALAMLLHTTCRDRTAPAPAAGGGATAGVPTVLIALPSGIDYVACFYGSLLAGTAAVTIALPSVMTAGAARAFEARLGHVLRQCDPAVVIGPPDVLALVPALPGAAGRLLLDPAALPRPGAEPAAFTSRAEPAGIALVQYTSGSTADPKGILVSHANLVHNVTGIIGRLRSAGGEHATGWLPLFHDMGLIGLILHPLAAGMTVNLLPPAAFLRRPHRWLEVISQTRSVLTMAPDFAYALTARRVTAAQCAGLDLSCLRHAVTAAEPVCPDTIEAFVNAFTPYGLRRHSIRPAYGLAENTLCVTVDGSPSGPVLTEVSARRLHHDGRAEPPCGEQTQTLVGCGRDLIRGCVTAIVDPDSRVPVRHGSVGEIWVTGPSVAVGYLGQDSAATFAARIPGDDRSWLRTGDLGVTIDGVLYVVGRLKDVFVRNGVNHYLHELEATASESHPALLPGGAAAFAVPGAAGDRLILVHELAGPARLDRAAVLNQIRYAVTARHGMQPDAVAVLRRGALPKTTSGKLRRGECARQWQAGEFAPLACWEAAPAGVAVRPGCTGRGSRP